MSKRQTRPILNRRQVRQRLAIADRLASSILVLCDGGGSNSSRYYVFNEALQKLVNHIGIEIRILSHR